MFAQNLPVNKKTEPKYSELAIVTFGKGGLAIPSLGTYVSKEKKKPQHSRCMGVLTCRDDPETSWQRSMPFSRGAAVDQDTQSMLLPTTGLGMSVNWAEKTTCKCAG